MILPNSLIEVMEIHELSNVHKVRISIVVCVSQHMNTPEGLELFETKLLQSVGRKPGEEESFFSPPPFFGNLLKHTHIHDPDRN